MPLRIGIPPPHIRQPSGGNLSYAPVQRHRKSPSMEKSKRSSGQAPEEKKVLGLFRRKSSKSISKKNVSAPIIGPNDTVPAIPGMPVGTLYHNMPLTPITPGPLTSGFESAPRTLPSGPAPPRPARPDSFDDAANPMDPNEPFPPPRTNAMVKSSTAPALPPPPQPCLPQIAPNPRGWPTYDSRPEPDSDVSVHMTTNTSPERPTYPTAGLPQISEEEDATSPTTKDLNPPPSAWPEDRLRASNGSRHTPSESTSSNGSRFGFDKQSTSSMSSPPTSSASSFQLKDTLDDVRSPATTLLEPQSVSPKIGTSPRTANFSRPRAPTLNSTSSNQGTHLSPPLGGAAAVVESPVDPPTPGDKRFEPTAVLPPAQEPSRSLAAHSAEQQLPPTLQAVSYQRQPPSSKMLSQPFARPPLPPMPEDQPLELSGRPSLSRSKSTASKGQCRGCRHEITGRSVKAADGRLSGRWHKECFVCRTCRSPFQTADFYVLRDEPYCSHHYHVLNNSLCRHCHTGIEGRYFEIDGRRRFHTGCFACADCRRPLEGDYFEIGTRFYCDFDAQRFHQKTTHLNPGKRFPERRTTKLMEM